jgi:hypothetical protein
MKRAEPFLWVAGWLAVVALLTWVQSLIDEAVL